MNKDNVPAMKIASVIMAILAIIALLIVCFACTTINIIHSQGEATDLIDETQTASPQVETSLSSIPGV